MLPEPCVPAFLEPPPPEPPSFEAGLSPAPIPPPPPAEVIVVKPVPEIDESLPLFPEYGEV